MTAELEVQQAVGRWAVYLLHHPLRSRTYVGCTTDVRRRLRQHNREIRGGARATGICVGWQLVCWVGGFQSRSDAYRWEKLVKGRVRGLRWRKLALWELAVLGVCPEGRVPYQVPRGLQYHEGDHARTE